MLATGLGERGWDVRVIARSGTLQRVAVWSEGNVRVVEIPGFSNMILGALLYLLATSTLGFLWSLRAFRLVSFQLGTQTTAACVASVITRTPCFAFSTSSGNLSELELLLQRPFPGIRRRVLNRVTAFVAQTVEGAEEISSSLPEAAVHVLPTPVIEAPWYSLDGRPRVLFAGRFSSEKDLPTLLLAWRSVTQQLENAVLTLTGSGGSFRSIETELIERVRADDHLRISVRFTGWVKDVSPLLQDHDVFVLPSLSEGMSNSLVEACAAGRVVVVSDIPSNRAVVGDDYPLIYPAGDGRALESMILAALRDGGVREHARERLRIRIERHLLVNVLNEFEELAGLASCTGDQ
jgi:glycosyltransferase involved in cell wall biosynthesis